VVLYEMLTGTKPFPGDDVSQTLARVIDRGPDWDALPATLSPALDRYLRRCLQKNPRQRVRDIGDVRLAMEGAFETTVSATVEPTAAPQHQVWQRPAVVAMIALGAAGVAGLAVWAATRPEPVPPPDLVQFAIVPPNLTRANNVRDIAISPDGTQVVYGVDSEAGPQLYLHSLNQLDGVPLRGTERGVGPFFSPDGEWVGFVGPGGTMLQKVSIVGGLPVTLFESPIGILGASWGTDDKVIIGSPVGGLVRVSAVGGEPETLTTLDTAQGEANHSWPFILPGREAVVFVISTGVPLTTGELAVLDLDTGNVTRLGLAGISPHYVSTGHLVYAAEDGSLRAVPFDAASLEITGSPVPLVGGIEVEETGAANFCISDAGSLMYVPGGTASNDRMLALVRHDGVVEALDVSPAPYLVPRLSPDGGKLVVQTVEDDGNVIWLYDLAGDTQIQQLTFEGDNQRPIWTPDSQRITFSSDRDGTMSLYSMPADGRGTTERLTTAEEGTLHWPGSWSPDGQTLLVHVQRALVTDWDIWSLSASGREVQSLYDTPDTIYNGAEVSPDGQWLAYAAGPSSLEMDIYVEPFPPTGARRRISQDGGYWPRWSPDGDRLFYRPVSTTAGITLRSVDVVTEPDFAFGNEQTLPIERFIAVAFHRNYDITPDGEGLVMVFPADQTETGAASRSQIIMILNWAQELTQRVPID